MRFRPTLNSLDERITPTVTTATITPTNQWSQLPPSLLNPGVVSGSPSTLETAVTNFQQWFSITFNIFNPSPGTSYEGLVAQYSALLVSISGFDEVILRDIASHEEAQERLSDFEQANPNVQPPLDLIIGVNQAGYMLFQHLNARNEVAAEARAILSFLQLCKANNYLSFQQGVALDNLAVSSPPAEFVLFPINSITIILPNGSPFTPGWPMAI